MTRGQSQSLLLPPVGAVGAGIRHVATGGRCVEFPSIDARKHGWLSREALKAVTEKSIKHIVGVLMCDQCRIQTRNVVRQRVVRDGNGPPRIQQSA